MMVSIEEMAVYFPIGGSSGHSIGPEVGYRIDTMGQALRCDTMGQRRLCCRWVYTVMYQHYCI